MCNRMLWYNIIYSNISHAVRTSFQQIWFLSDLLFYGSYFFKLKLLWTVHQGILQPTMHSDQLRRLRKETYTHAWLTVMGWLEREKVGGSSVRPGYVISAGLNIFASTIVVPYDSVTVSNCNAYSHISLCGSRELRGDSWNLHMGLKYYTL
jgi:hypothetical protein